MKIAKTVTIATVAVLQASATDIIVGSLLNDRNYKNF